MKQEMTGWQWHQLDHMQIICTSIQTDYYAIRQQGVQKILLQMTTVNEKIQFAGACRGRSGKVSGEEPHRSGTGGNRNTYPNHCTADFHAVSTVRTSFDEALNTLRGCQYHQTASINEPPRFIDCRVQGCTKKHATGHGHGHCASQNYPVFYEVVRRHV